MITKTQSSELCQAFCSYLKERGGRFTPERAAILQGIEQGKLQFRIEDLKLYLEQTRFRVSQATLYNTLNELIEGGFIARILLDEETVYELSYKEKYSAHMVCTHCGKITEFANEELDALIQKMKFKRFTYRSYDLLVRGLCSVCKAQLKRAEKKKNNLKNNIEK